MVAELHPVNVMVKNGICWDGEHFEECLIAMLIHQRQFGTVSM